VLVLFAAERPKLSDPAGWHWQMSRRKILLSVQAHHRLVSQCSVRVERLYLETIGDGASFRASALAVKGRLRLLKHKNL
jgi:hypothetical protein